MKLIMLVVGGALAIPTAYPKSGARSVGALQTSESPLSTPLPCEGDPAPEGSVPPASLIPAISLFKLQTDLPRCDGRSHGVRQVLPAELASYSSSRFYGNATDGSVVIITDITGATTSLNAQYRRQELREMMQWPFATGWHSMLATMAVTNLPRGGTVIAQIKPSVPDHNLPLFKLRAKAYGSTRPRFRLEARVKVNRGTNTLRPREIGLRFRRLFSLGEPISLQVVASQLVLHVTVTAAGEPPQTVTYDYHGVPAFDRSDAVENIYYFKVGNYCQTSVATGASPDDTCDVVLNSVEVTHAEAAPSLTTKRTASFDEVDKNEEDEENDEVDEEKEDEEGEEDEGA